MRGQLARWGGNFRRGSVVGISFQSWAFGVVAAILGMIMASAALAQPVLITTPTTLNPGDTIIGGVPLETAQITVRGTTLTLNGRFRIASLTVERNAANQPGIVTHDPNFRHSYDGGDIVQGCDLTVDADVNIGINCLIRLDSRGNPSDTGPGAGTVGPSNTGGGGGYGGEGGNGSNGGQGGLTYGSLTQPVDLGSGGGTCQGCGPGGIGGGALRLTVGGTLTVGAGATISANGQSTGDFAGFAGGGSGGSLWINCGTLTGSGQITANGGSGRNGNGGGGGGGRIAVYACNRSLPNSNISANTSPRAGRNGTVYFGPCPASNRLTSSSIGYYLPITGSLQQQVTQINNSPPAFSEAWTQLASSQRHGVEFDTSGVWSFRCGEVNNPLSQGFVSALTYLADADQVTFDNCHSAWYRFSFILPSGYRSPTLFGSANTDDVAVAYLNGQRITAAITSTDLASIAAGTGPDRTDPQGRSLLSWPTLDAVASSTPAYFRRGENELIFGVCGDASELEPTGLEFSLTMSYINGCSADFNNDGDIGTDQDIEAFFACLAGNCCGTCPRDADFNGDGDIGTDADIESFFRVLAGGAC